MRERRYTTDGGMGGGGSPIPFWWEDPMRYLWGTLFFLFVLFLLILWLLWRPWYYLTSTKEKRQMDREGYKMKW